MWCFLNVKYRLIIQKLGVLNGMLKEAEAIIHNAIPYVGFVTQNPVLCYPVKYFSGSTYHLNNVLYEDIKR